MLARSRSKSAALWGRRRLRWRACHFARGSLVAARGVDREDPAAAPRDEPTPIDAARCGADEGCLIWKVSTADGWLYAYPQPTPHLPTDASWHESAIGLNIHTYGQSVRHGGLDGTHGSRSADGISAWDGHRCKERQRLGAIAVHQTVHHRPLGARRRPSCLALPLPYPHLSLSHITFPCPNYPRLALTGPRARVP